MSEKPRSKIVPVLIWIFFCAIPTVVSLYIAIEFRNLTQNLPPPNTQSSTSTVTLTCYPDQQCAVEVNGQWYAIDRPIPMPRP